MINLAWINDFKVGELQGGNSVTSELFIKKGRKLGYNIEEISHKDFSNHDLEKFDFFILNNINMFQADDIWKIINEKEFMKLEHDYCFCQYRNGNCPGCKIKCEPADIFKELFANSKLNMFFSPLQLSIFKKFFGQTMRDAIVIPAPIERGKWYPDKIKQQKNSYLYAGALMSHKGIHQILDFADTLKKGEVFHFAGRAYDKKVLERIKKDYVYLGVIPHNEMPALLRKYENFVINPQMPESFGLSVIEAMMSGCNIIKFQKSHETGLESYGLSPGKMIDLCLEAPDNFWEEVKRVLPIKEMKL